MTEDFGAVNAKVTDLSKNYGLKVNDILITANPNPGDEFLLCNGDNIDPIEGVNLNYSRYEIELTVDGDTVSGAAYPNIAYDGNDTIGILESIDNIRILGVSKSTGNITSTLVYDGGSPSNLVYYKGYWVITSVRNHILYIYTAPKPNVAWSLAYSSSYHGNNPRMRIVNDTLVILVPWMNKSSYDTGTNYIIYTNDVASGFTKVSTETASYYTHSDKLGISYCGGLWYIAVVGDMYDSGYYSVIYYSNSLSGPWTKLSVPEFHYKIVDMLPIEHDNSSKLACLVDRSGSKYNVLLIDTSDQSYTNTVLDIDVNKYSACMLRPYSDGYMIIPQTNYKILFSDTINGPYQEKDNSMYGSYYNIVGCGDTNKASIIYKTTTSGKYNLIFSEKCILPKISLNGSYAFLKIKDTEVT